MRKLFNFFAAALVMLAAASCEKNEVLPDSTEGKVVTLSATIDNGGTKTALGAKDGDTYPVLWSEGDQIAVIQDDVNCDNNQSVYTFTLSTGAKTTSATFTCANAEGFDPNYQYYAVYPASAVVISEGKFSGYKIPETQTYAQNSFGDENMPMLSGSCLGKNFPMNFKNGFGVLKLQLTGASGEKVTSIVITSNDPLSGGAEHSGGKIVLAVTADKKVTLDCSANGGVELDPNIATNFHIAVPAGATGLKVLINTNNGSYYKEVPSQSGEITNDIEAGKILKMRVLSINTQMTKLTANSYVEKGVYYGEGVTLPGPNSTTITWAPVNCGYDANHRYGLLYQWGRKYGQGYDGETPTTKVLELDDRISYIDGSLEDNKYKFYSYWAVWAEEWENAGKISVNLWNNVPGKTGYDPCPSGWRVPTIEELVSLVNGLSVDSNKGGLSSQWTDKSDDSNHIDLPGFWFYGNTTAKTGNSVFFPAAGSRWFGTIDGTPGVAIERGTKGSYWSSSLEDPSSSDFVYAWYFSGSSGSVSSDESYPAPGMSVRCVKVEP